MAFAGSSSDFEQSWGQTRGPARKVFLMGMGYEVLIVVLALFCVIVCWSIMDLAIICISYKAFVTFLF